MYELRGERKKVLLFDRQVGGVDLFPERKEILLNSKREDKIQKEIFEEKSGEETVVPAGVRLLQCEIPEPEHSKKKKKKGVGVSEHGISPPLSPSLSIYSNSFLFLSHTSVHSSPLSHDFRQLKNPPNLNSIFHNHSVIKTKSDVCQFGCNTVFYDIKQA